MRRFLGWATMPCMTEASKFWNRMADRYSRRPVPDEAVYREKLRLTQEYLQPDMRLLEFGCGTGSTAIEHAPHVAEIHATDLSSRMLEIARDKSRAAGIENIRYEEVSFESLDAADGAYDAILGLSILHLLDDWQGAIGKVHRLLKPGGVFVCGTVCVGDMSPVFRLLLPVLRLLRIAPPVHVLYEKSVVEALKSAGFSLVHHWRPGKNKAVFIIARKQPGTH
jgi:ubiquinone/menaquinone biosynthesis C-methylase UbiE